MTTEEQLKDLQIRIKKLASGRDTLIRDAGIQEQKLQEALEKLRANGIEEPEKIGEKELGEMAFEMSNQLDALVAELTAKIEDGERLLAAR